MSTDLLNRPLRTEEEAILAIYDSLREVLATELPPCAASNLRAALAAVAVTVTDLGLRYEHLLDEDV
ncbi:MAG TPA: hypothetical protein VG756_02530 [Pseudonocardiaceae bacterium]|jgi:hypothetical protein|nr:hypothetical protein [Pseudonocardiaceae bacterium]